MTLATEIAKKYKRKECLMCVTELCQNIQGTVLTIDIQDLTGFNRNYIYYEDGSDNFSISDTGLHYGFLVGANVYDNLNSKGVSEKDWLAKFLFHCPEKGPTTVTSAHVRRQCSVKFLEQVNDA
ncbi:papain fold toxin domain-containing protein [Vibrio atlanticus]|uniref:papain fold toxin domain-containing protein n=1 Tax=Vibrio atlanticus TaxID=693153 RepID=UPI0022B039B0|nr:papain fold toxin domain-containing protein [Vibrio atlanticus]MCZ4309895.1 hypothetical protein [Vibrio atlanticus]